MKYLYLKEIGEYTETGFKNRQSHKYSSFNTKLLSTCSETTNRQGMKSSKNTSELILLFIKQLKVINLLSIIKYKNVNNSFQKNFEI